MKKSFTISLNGRVYHINDDAFELLNAYLDNLKSHFAREEGAQEILEDIEARIGELFSERMRYGLQVISDSEVRQVITIMGHPEEIGEAEVDLLQNGTLAEPSLNSTAEDMPEAVTESDATMAAEQAPKQRKRFYRDTDDRVIAGVCSGLGYYLKVDPWIIRAVFLLAFLFGLGSSVLIYLVIWIIVPECKTVAQKLQMRGEPATVENIRQAIHEGELQAAPRSDGYSVLGRIGVVLFGGCLGIVILSILLVVIVSNIPFGLMPPFGHGFPTTHTFQIMGNPFPYLLGWGLLIGLPIYRGVNELMVRFKGATPITAKANWTLLGIWIAALLVVLFV